MPSKQEEGSSFQRAWSSEICAAKQELIWTPDRCFLHLNLQPPPVRPVEQAPVGQAKPGPRTGEAGPAAARVAAASFAQQTDTAHITGTAHRDA